MAYTKLFNSIVTSTIWTEDDRTRIVWITMLACADKNGEIQASIPGLARIAGVPVEDCRVAITKFLSPDQDSRTKDDEGRRIEEIDGGWSLLNFRKYREMASKEDSQASEAARKARYRAKIARNVPKCPAVVPVVSTVDSHIAEAEAEAEAIIPLAPKGELLTFDDETSTPKPAWNPSEVQIGVAGWFNRKPSTKWNDAELKAWKKFNPDDEELDILDRYYSFKPGKDETNYWPRTGLCALLNNWQSEVDKARAFFDRKDPRGSAYSKPTGI